ncbi:MAG: hypothetical protein EOP04_33215 [Proteobacteria bacterium]|nr:MAG: hypothetical protein EOP04_33215 [Pseudomonadota bacterium]
MSELNTSPYAVDPGLVSKVQKYIEPAIAMLSREGIKINFDILNDFETGDTRLLLFPELLSGEKTTDDFLDHVALKLNKLRIDLGEKRIFMTIR